MALQMTQTDVQTEFRGLIDDWARAVRAKDLDEIFAHYAPDLVAFDGVGQLQFKGRDAYRKHWEACIAMCSGPMIFEVHDLDIEARDDLAFGHYLSRCGETGSDGEEQTGWFRATVCWRKTDGRWQVAHEHFSAPFDPARGKALLDLQPSAPARLMRHKGGTGHGVRVTSGEQDMADERTRATAEAEIRALLDHQAKTIRAKDVNGSVSSYAPDVLLFDVVSPLRSTGSDALRHRLTAWFGSFEGPIGYELRDLSITTGGDVAFSHSLNRVSATAKVGTKFDMWWRATACYRRLEDEWMITHAHASVPFDAESGQASLDLKP